MNFQKDDKVFWDEGRLTRSAEMVEFGTTWSRVKVSDTGDPTFDYETVMTRLLRLKEKKDV